MFKEITEAYSVLGDAEKRARYDRLILGESGRRDFENQESYEYWKDREAHKDNLKQFYEKNQDRIKEKLRNAKDYNDFIERMENHREKHRAREHLFRGEGFKELNHKYGLDYDYFNDVEQEQKDKYIKYRERYWDCYWDTKENHEYYQQPASTRAWI